MHIAVLIVSWESERYIEAAINSVIDQLAASDSIVVWDNASSARSRAVLETIAARMPSVEFHFAPANTGFAGGNNSASALRPMADAYLTLNPDAILQEGAVQAMQKILQDQDGIGAVGAVQLSDDEKTIDGLGDVYHISGLAWRDGYGKDAARWFGSSIADTEEYSEIFAPCAAVALYRREAFEQAGGFDADYFCYCEDNDLGFRMRLLGWRCVRANQAYARHVGSTSLGKNSDFSVYHGQRNLVWTFFKNMPTALLIPLFPVHVFANLAIILLYSFRRRSGVILRAKIDAIRGLPSALNKRAAIQLGRKSSLAQTWNALSKKISR